MCPTSGRSVGWRALPKAAGRLACGAAIRVENKLGELRKNVIGAQIAQDDAAIICRSVANISATAATTYQVCSIARFSQAEPDLVALRPFRVSYVSDRHTSLRDRGLQYVVGL